jgi:hypothetical protein
LPKGRRTRYSRLMNGSYRALGLSLLGALALGLLLRLAR